MSAPGRVLLVRHGRTALNAEGRLRGLADPDLDELGAQQAERTALALARLGPVAFVASSPLLRARRTAERIATASGGAWAVDPAFTDRDYGPWTGELRSEVVARWGRVDDAPGVEPAADVLARACRGLDALARGDLGRLLAVVTHDAVIRPLLESIRPGIRPLVETGSWTELVRDGDGWRIVSVDNAP